MKSVFLLVGLGLVTPFSMYSTIAQPDAVPLSDRYTAQKHFEDLIELLNQLDYKPDEVGIFSFNKRKVYHSIKALNDHLKERLTEESNNVFLLFSIPLLNQVIHVEEYFSIEPAKALKFYTSFIDILKKRNAQLALFTQEEERLLEDELGQGWRRFIPVN